MNNSVKEALTYYDINDPQLDFIRHNENETYHLKDGLTNNQYLLRIHNPNTDFSLDIFGGKNHSIELLTSEMNILAAIYTSKEIPLQKPVKNKQGDYVTLLADGTPATLLSWVEGTTVEKCELTEDILFKIGEMTGKLHRFLKGWAQGQRLKRYSYDQELLSRMVLKIQEGLRENIITLEQFKIIDKAIVEITNRMKGLELENHPMMVLHSDLSKSNLIIDNNGQIVPIDFCLCGYSYDYMDLGSLFSQFRKEEERNCIIKGYKSIINKDIDPKYIEAFMVYQIILFIATHIESAHKWDWFSSTIDRWSREFFVPLASGTSFI